ncbi:hypothetical protein CC2G_000154 [Coprinopsis cinerea AmutBmut pab1-1]|nr:hypothetical protein CC2G_000154 [Coprinopsis cinerea AmutBmut pab1-1]
MLASRPVRCTRDLETAVSLATNGSADLYIICNCCGMLLTVSRNMNQMWPHRAHRSRKSPAIWTSILTNNKTP